MVINCSIPVLQKASRSVVFIEGGDRQFPCDNFRMRQVIRPYPTNRVDRVGTYGQEFSPKLRLATHVVLRGEDHLVISSLYLFANRITAKIRTMIRPITANHPAIHIQQ